MLYEAWPEAGRDLGTSRPGQDGQSAVTEALADVRALGGANVSTSMKQKALVDDASTPGLAQPGLASSMVSSKKLKVEPPLGVELTLPDKFERDVRKSQLSHSAFQIVGAGISNHRRDRVASCCFV